MDLYAVVVEDRRKAMIENVLLYAAQKPEDAEAMARAFYHAGKKPVGHLRFSAQRVTEISGPGATLYRVVLQPLLPATC